jgi:hypothetical protein
MAALLEVEFEFQKGNVQIKRLNLDLAILQLRARWFTAGFPQGM